MPKHGLDSVHVQESREAKRQRLSKYDWAKWKQLPPCKPNFDPKTNPAIGHIATPIQPRSIDDSSGRTATAPTSSAALILESSAQRTAITRAHSIPEIHWSDGRNCEDGSTLSMTITEGILGSSRHFFRADLDAPSDARADVKSGQRAAVKNGFRPDSRVFLSRGEQISRSTGRLDQYSPLAYPSVHPNNLIPCSKLCRHLPLDDVVPEQRLDRASSSPDNPASDHGYDELVSESQSSRASTIPNHRAFKHNFTSEYLSPDSKKVLKPVAAPPTANRSYTAKRGPTTTFLSLPAELRIEVYRHVFDWSVSNWGVSENERTSRSVSSFRLGYRLKEMYRKLSHTHPQVFADVKVILRKYYSDKIVLYSRDNALQDLHRRLLACPDEVFQNGRFHLVYIPPQYRCERSEPDPAEWLTRRFITLQDIFRGNPSRGSNILSLPINETWPKCIGRRCYECSTWRVKRGEARDQYPNGRYATPKSYTSSLQLRCGQWSGHSRAPWRSTKTEVGTRFVLEGSIRDLEFREFYEKKKPACDEDWEQAKLVRRSVTREKLHMRQVRLNRSKKERFIDLKELREKIKDGAPALGKRRCAKKAKESLHLQALWRYD